VIFIDTIHVKIRDGQGANRPIYVVLAVACEGRRGISPALPVTRSTCWSSQPEQPRIYGSGLSRPVAKDSLAIGMPRLAVAVPPCARCAGVCVHHRRRHRRFSDVVAFDGQLFEHVTHLVAQFNVLEPDREPELLIRDDRPRKAAMINAARACKTRTSLFALPMVIRSPSKVLMFPTDNDFVGGRRPHMPM
jgi:hypothetical protein